MAGKGGYRPGAGRKKGIPNKLHASVKEAIEAAFTKAGGPDYLARQAVENPQAFMTLLGKLLPTQLTGRDGGPIESKLVGYRERLASRVSAIVDAGPAPETDCRTH